MTDHPPIPPDAILIHAFSDGEGPPPFHVRDQERLHAVLPRCALRPADRRDDVRCFAFVDASSDAERDALLAAVLTLAGDR